MEIYKKQSLSETFSVYFDKRMIKILLLGEKNSSLTGLESRDSSPVRLEYFANPNKILNLTYEA